MLWRIHGLKNGCATSVSKQGFRTEPGLTPQGTAVLTAGAVAVLPGSCRAWAGAVHHFIFT